LNDDDVSSNEMAEFSDMNDRDIERLFAGQTPDGDADLDALARFVEDLRRACPEAPNEALASAHVAAMVEASRLSAENGDPVARPASKADGPAHQASGLPKWRRNPMLKRLFGSPLARVAILAVGLMLVFSGVAVAGALPDQIQTPVSNAAQTIGVDLPCPDDDGDVDDVDDGDVDDADDLEVSDETVGEADDAGDVRDEKMDIIDADDQGEDADDQGEDSDQVDEAADEAEDAADEAEDAADEAADAAEDAADEAADDAEDQADEQADQAEDQADQAADDADDAADQAEDQADDAEDANDD
jgi:hypothetical protein